MRRVARRVGAAEARSREPEEEGLVGWSRGGLAAAHRIKPHDLVIIASWTEMEDDEARSWEAKRVFVDARNRIRD